MSRNPRALMTRCAHPCVNTCVFFLCRKCLLFINHRTTSSGLGLGDHREIDRSLSDLSLSDLSDENLCRSGRCGKTHPERGATVPNDDGLKKRRRAEERRTPGTPKCSEKDQDEQFRERCRWGRPGSHARGTPKLRPSNSESSEGVG